jgi:pantoate--beta-alanine ligase
VTDARVIVEQGARVDYVELRDADSLHEIARLERPAVLGIAAFVGKTRLIDNRVLRPVG